MVAASLFPLMGDNGSGGGISLSPDRRPWRWRRWIREGGGPAAPRLRRGGGANFEWEEVRDKGDREEMNELGEALVHVSSAVHLPSMWQGPGRGREGNLKLRFSLIN